MVVNMAMVRSSEHTTPQHTTCTFYTDTGRCAFIPCVKAPCPAAWLPPLPLGLLQGGQQLGQGGGGESHLVRSREPACVHFFKGSSRFKALSKSAGALSKSAASSLSSCQRPAQPRPGGVSSSGAGVLGNVVIGVLSADILAVVKGMHRVH